MGGKILTNSRDPIPRPSVNDARRLRGLKVRPRNLLRPSVLRVIHFAPMKRFWCYIMSNKSRRLYVGFTDDLFRRVIEHREKLFPGSFTARYAFRHAGFLRRIR